MSSVSVINQLGVFFGGPYDAARRLYATPGAPSVAGLYTVRRAWPKRHDDAEFFYGTITPQRTGAQGVLFEARGQEHRVALGGATSGVKRQRHMIDFAVFVRSTEAYAEDALDFTYGVRDAIFAKIRTDRTCGSGGFELGGFQVGETDPWLTWRLSEPVTSAEVTKLYLVISFEAHEYLQA